MAEATCRLEVTARLASFLAIAVRSTITSTSVLRGGAALLVKYSPRAARKALRRGIVTGTMQR
jgi:hypothetical protein